MPLIQSIDSALEKNIGPHGVADKALNAALDRAEAALEVLRARHADGGLPLLQLPQTHDDLVEIRDTGRRLAENATDIVFLGTGGSSARRADAGAACRSRGARRRCAALAAAPAFHGQSRCGDFCHAAGAAAASDHALCRHFEIRRHRGNADADHRRAGGGESRGARPAHSRYFPRPHRAGQARQAQRLARIAQPRIMCPCSIIIPASAAAFRR